MGTLADSRQMDARCHSLKGRWTKGVALCPKILDVPAFTESAGGDSPSGKNRLLLQYPGTQVYFESTFLNARNGAMAGGWK
jgi:hypothetical protein